MVGKSGIAEGDKARGPGPLLVFRERKGLDTVMLTEDCHSINITLEDDNLKNLQSQGKSPANMVVAILSWEDIQQEETFYFMCEVGLKARSKDVTETALQGLCQGKYIALRKLTVEFFRHFNAKITRVKYFPLSFEFAYMSPNAFEELGPRIGAIEDLFKEVCSELVHHDLSVSVCLHQSEEDEEEDLDEDLEFTLSLYDSENEEDERSAYSQQYSRGTMVKQSRALVAGHGKRIANIEQELKVQKQQINDRFDETKRYNESQEQLLRSLASNVGLLVEQQTTIHTSSLKTDNLPSKSLGSKNCQDEEQMSEQTSRITDERKSQINKPETVADEKARYSSLQIDSSKSPDQSSTFDENTPLYEPKNPNPIVQKMPHAQTRTDSELERDPQHSTNELSSQLGKGARPKDIRQTSIMQKQRSPIDKSNHTESNQSNLPTLKLSSDLKPKGMMTGDKPQDRGQYGSLNFNTRQIQNPIIRPAVSDTNLYHSLNLTRQKGKSDIKKDTNETMSASLSLLDKREGEPRDGKSTISVRQKTHADGSLPKLDDDIRSKSPPPWEVPEQCIDESPLGVNSKIPEDEQMLSFQSARAMGTRQGGQKEEMSNILPRSTKDLRDEAFTEQAIEQRTSKEVNQGAHSREHWVGSSQDSQDEDEKPLYKSSTDQLLESSVLQGNTGGKARHFLATHGVKGTTPGVRKMIATVEAAMKDDGIMPPTATGLNTVLCLDTSDAMGEDDFVKMKNAAGDFIDGVEDIAGSFEIEENIAVVAFGGKTHIAHHLSNDYSSVKQAVDDLGYGGNGSIFEALLVSLCALREPTGSHRNPRLIVMTSGNTIDEIEESAQDMETIANNSKDRVIKLVDEFRSGGEGASFPRPIIWVPFNDDDMDFFEHLSDMEQCSVAKCDDLKTLCAYQRNQELVRQAYRAIRDKMILGNNTVVDESILLDEVKRVAGNLTLDDLEGLVSDVEKMLEETLSKTQLMHPERLCSKFDNVMELPDTNLPRLGVRVVRGSDWRRGEEDSKGPGTVVNHISGDIDERKIIWVLWDNGPCGKYRYGYQEAYDVKVTEDKPRATESDLVIHVGCEVTRGRDWSEKYDDQDGGPGGVGVVIRKNEHGKVKVRWSRTAHTNEYRYGKDNKHDLRIRDPEECLMVYAAGTDRKSETSVSETVSSKGKAAESGGWVWQWKNEYGAWKLYDKIMCDKLEREYQKRKEGSCVVKKDGQSFRVLFKTFMEKGVSDNTIKHGVRRICLSESDQAAMRSSDDLSA